eukprot:7464305-Pyramimonas_sp.AAC.1
MEISRRWSVFLGLPGALRGLRGCGNFSRIHGDPRADRAVSGERKTRVCRDSGSPSFFDDRDSDFDEE